jgi:HEPN domain-containing protein
MNDKKLHEDPKRTTPIGLARYAADFFDTALAADEIIGRRPGFEIIAPIPVMYLVGHAIELALKAYLLANGITLRKLKRNYGHDLHRILRKAKELGLQDSVELTDDDESMVELLNELYSTKQLQYIVSGSKTYPVFGPLHEVAEKLVRGIGENVGYRPVRK